MIDIENVLYTELYNALKEKFPALSISGIEERLPSSFPFVSIVEADNLVRSDTIDSSNRENHVNLLYEVNIYSNKAGERKTEAKSILAEIDRQLTMRGFMRTAAQPVSLNDGTIYRIIARYTGCADKNNVIYRR